MRKAVLIISLFLLCTIVSAEDYRREAQISFTAGLVANVGFTASPVSKDNYIKPVELSGENSVFEFRGSSNNYNALSTDSFYIYWQIFSPYQLKIYAEIEPLKPTGGEGNAVTWTDAAGTISGTRDTYGYLIFGDEATDRSEPRVDSKMVSPVIEGENLDLLDWNKTYTGSIVLKVVVG